MAKRADILAGAADHTIDVFIQDSSSALGAGLSGLVFNSSGLLCYYRKGATGSATALSLATQTVGGAHSDGGFVQIDATNMTGLYRLDLSDTIVSTAGMVSIYLSGAANMVPCILELEVQPATGKVVNATTVSSGAIVSGAHAAAELNAIADAVLDRNMTTGTDSGTDSTAVRTVRQALRRLRNKEEIVAGTGTIYKENDSSASWTYAATATAGNPLSAVDPT